MKKILLTLFSLSLVLQTFAQCPISADAGNGLVTDSIEVCQNTTITFSTTGAGPYNWDITDVANSIQTGTNQTITYTFVNEGGYIINLDCSGVITSFKVKVSLTPRFNGTSLSDDTICPGTQIDLNGSLWGNQTDVGGNIISDEWFTPLPSQVYAGIYLPDGNGQSYQTSITQTQFNSGQTITAGNQVASICINLEHSYLGDLQIELACPNGQTVILKPYPGGSNCFLGEPCDNNTTVQGNCYEYCFTETSPTYNTMLNEVGNWQYSYTDNAGASYTNHDYLPAGTYLPEQSFSNFIGCPLNGNWTITITDNMSIDDGYLCDWSINFAPSIIPNSLFTFHNTYTTTWLGSGVTGNLNNDHGTPVCNNCISDYTYQITDDFGCVYDTTLSVVVRDSGSVQCCTFPVTYAGNDDSTCTGTITLNATMFHTWYTGLWSLISGPGTANFTDNTNPNTDVTMSTPGTYQFQWEEHSSTACFDRDTVTIYYYPTPTVSFNTTNARCNNSCDGQIVATPTGTGTPYTYLWDDPSTQATNTASNLCAGNYTVSITNRHGCTATQTETVTEPTALQQVLTVTDVLCYGNNDGSISAAVSGGTSPYTYQWNDSNHQTTAIATALGHGNYTVTTTDDNGCQIISSATVNEPQNPLKISTVDSTNVLCNGQSNGSIDINVSGGTFPYTYNWSNSVTTQDNNNIPAGIYTVTVTDANNCTANKTYVITEPSELTFTNTSTSASCFGYGDGTASILPSGGTPPYSYLWSNNMTTQSITNVYAGAYNVSVTDANGCKIQFTSTVTQPDKVVAAVTQDQTICIGQSATIHCSATGGNAPYTYSWNTGSSNSDITTSPTSTQSYYVTVTDSHGCTSNTGTTTIKVNPPLNLNISLDDYYVCKGDPVVISMDPTGGNGHYTYTLEDGTIVGNPATYYPINANKETIKVILSDNCGTPTTFDTVTVTILPLPEFTFQPDITNGCQPLDVHFNAISTNPNLQYYWNFGDENQSSNLSDKPNPTHTFNLDGKFSITLIAKTDSGCKNTLTVPDLITVYKNPTAKFNTDKKIVSVIRPIVEFDNISSNGFNYYWTFGDGDSSIIKSPAHKFPLIADKEYNVKLLVISDMGCKDSTYEKIYIKDEYTFYYPNAFTPDGDNINDYWYIFGNGIDEKDFDLLIYDRWGEIIFETTKPNDKWDGTIKGKEKANAGIYTFKIYYKDKSGLSHTQTGNFTLIR